MRDEARRQGLVVADKGESMEICFVDGAIEPFLEARLAAAGGGAGDGARRGGGAEVVDRSGRRLGTAGAYYRYTVGQRRGLGVAGGDRLYVLEIQPAERRVVVGGRDELRSNGLRRRAPALDRAAAARATSRRRCASDRATPE